MASNTLQRTFCLAITFVALVCFSGCAVPLAPGYKIEKQSISVRFVPGTPPHLAVRAEYRLANVGNSNLDSIEVGLPEQKSFGLQNLRVLLNGREVTPEIAPGAEADEGESVSSDSWPVVWRIPFSPAWHRKQKRNLDIEYNLTAASDPRGRMYVAPTMFYLNDTGWFPDPLAPKNFLAKDLVRPNPSDLNVIVPGNFLAHGSGEPRGARKSGADTEYRFRIRKDDFDPFVIAGQYHEQRVSTSGGSVVIWTFKPLPPADAQKSAEQIAGVASLYSKTFGTLPRSMNAIYDVDLSVDASATVSNPSAQDIFGHFLPGVVYDWFLSPYKSSWTTKGNTVIARSGFAQLGFSWFAHLARPEPDAAILAAALTARASDVEEESEAGESRARLLASKLSSYDSSLQSTAEKPIVTLSSSESPDRLGIGEAKLTLFLFALEDRCGSDNLHHAIAHMVSALRFQQYGYDDFRSAVEQECHQDLGPFFRSWLNEKGIPADFRAKYGAAPEKKN